MGALPGKRQRSLNSTLFLYLLLYTFLPFFRTFSKFHSVPISTRMAEKDLCALLSSKFHSVPISTRSKIADFHYLPPLNSTLFLYLLTRGQFSKLQRASKFHSVPISTWTKMWWYIRLISLNSTLFLYLRILISFAVFSFTTLNSTLFLYLLEERVTIIMYLWALNSTLFLYLRGRGNEIISTE